VHAVQTIRRAAGTHRGNPGEHLEEEHAQRPPVNAEAVGVAAHHLGREVLWRAAEGLCEGGPDRPALETRGGAQALGQSEVDQLQVASRIEQQVLGLEVPIHHAAHLVQVLEHVRNGGRVKKGRRLLEPPEDVEKGVKLAAQNRLQQEVEATDVLEGSDEMYDRGVRG